MGSAPAPVRTPEEYAAAYRAGAPVAVEGLVGRVLKGRVEEDFARLSHDEDRRVVYLMDPEGLASLVGLDADATLERIGYRPDYVTAKRAQGFRFELVVFHARSDVVPATWDHLPQLVEQAYPGLGAHVEAHLPILQTSSYPELVAASGGYPWHPVRDTGRGHPEFFAAARYAREHAEPWQTRAFLYCELRLTDLYSGDGYTRTPDGERGLAEWATANRALADLGERVRIPLE
jgi:hypothetical protein